MVPARVHSPRAVSHLRHARSTGVSRTLANEMSTAHPEPNPSESLELPVEELLRRGRPHPPYGDQVIEDLTPEEGDAFLDAVLS